MTPTDPVRPALPAHAARWSAVASRRRLAILVTASVLAVLGTLVAPVPGGAQRVDAGDADSSAALADLLDGLVPESVAVGDAIDLAGAQQRLGAGHWDPSDGSADHGHDHDHAAGEHEGRNRLPGASALDTAALDAQLEALVAASQTEGPEGVALLRVGDTERGVSGSVIGATDVPPVVTQAVLDAIDTWGRSVDFGGQSFDVQLYWTDLGDGVLGGAMPYEGIVDVDGLQVAVPDALIDALQGRDLFGGAEAVLALNSALGPDGDGDGIPDEWVTGPGDAGVFDLTTVALHELGHTLGFAYGGSADGLGSPVALMSLLLETGSGRPLSSGFDAMISSSGDVWFRNADGTRDLAFASGPFAPGSTLSHVDEIRYRPGSGGGLMTPFLDRNERIAGPDGVALSLLQTIGWDLLVTPSALSSLTVLDAGDGWWLEVGGSTAPSAIGAAEVSIEMRDAAGTPIRRITASVWDGAHFLGADRPGDRIVVRPLTAAGAGPAIGVDVPGAPDPGVDPAPRGCTGGALAVFAPDASPSDGTVFRLYCAFFLRTPDQGGFEYWRDQHAAGWSLRRIAEFFSVSPEFVATYGSLTDTEFTTLVYGNVMGRRPDAGGYAYWTERLAGGLPRGEMMLLFSDSPEYRALTG